MKFSYDYHISVILISQSTSLVTTQDTRSYRKFPTLVSSLQRKYADSTSDSRDPV